MSSISDIIEYYLKKSLQESCSGTIEIKRGELADKFQCVPSQINYVISTRFTIEKGYIVESKRGGGGYIRIRKVSFPSGWATLKLLLSQIGQSMSQAAAEDVIDRLTDEGLLTAREAYLMRGLISRKVLKLPMPVRDQVRARMMQTLVTTLFAEGGK